MPSHSMDIPQHSHHARHGAQVHNQPHHSSQASNPSGEREPERDSDDDEYGSGEEESQHGGDNINGDNPRKRQKRPLSVS